MTNLSVISMSRHACCHRKTRWKRPIDKKIAQAPPAVAQSRPIAQRRPFAQRPARPSPNQRPEQSAANLCTPNRGLRLIVFGVWRSEPGAAGRIVAQVWRKRRRHRGREDLNCSPLSPAREGEERPPHPNPSPLGERKNSLHHVTSRIS